MSYNDGNMERIIKMIGFVRDTMPLGVKKALVMGFSGDYNFDKESEPPVATVVDSSPAGLLAQLTGVVMLFELKNVQDYVFCVEMAARQAESVEQERIVEEETGEADLNSLFFIVQCNGEKRAFIKRHDQASVFDVTRLIDAIPSFKVYSDLGPTGELRSIIRGTLTDDLRVEGLRLMNAVTQRTTVHDAGTEIKEFVSPRVVH